MTGKSYQTLDEYLDDLDQIKERLAEKTREMTPEQFARYLAGAKKRLQKCTGVKVRLGKSGRRSKKASPH